eukprot:7376273-Prymnesium_polylepis.1
MSLPALCQPLLGQPGGVTDASASLSWRSFSWLRVGVMTAAGMVVALHVAAVMHVGVLEASAATPPAKPRDLTGQPIPQVLQERAWRGESISLHGSDWEPMNLEPAVSSSREPGKGWLHPSDAALVIIDMQPLFFDAVSPWGVAATPDCPGGGLPCTSMNDLWPRQLRLAHAFAAWTGSYNSIFLTKYAVPASTNVSKGIMMHYYGMAPWNGQPEEHAATKEALDSMCAARGCATLASKPTGGSFSPDSELPAALDRYAAPKSAPSPWKTLVVAGVETDYCVLSTILGAIDRYSTASSWSLTRWQVASQTQHRRSSTILCGALTTWLISLQRRIC